jgi:hypothetical protein
MSSAEIDLPCGGLAYVVGNVFQKGARADSRDMIKFAAELAGGACLVPQLPEQELFVVNNTMVSEYGSTTYFIRGYGAAPMLWAKNNIFWGGASQPINWPANGTKVEQANVTADPKLLSPNTFDYRLTAASTAVINQGVAPGLDSRGFNLAPSQEYTYDRGTRPRAVVGAIDVGAFEYAAGAVAFATPTATMANTPTPSPIPTATSSTPFYCASGQGDSKNARV